MARIASIKGFALIELLIVVALIGIMAAIALPGYIGMQDRSREKAVQRTAQSSVPELQQRLTTAKKTGSPQTLHEVNTNGDGYIDSSDLQHGTLIAGFAVPNQFSSSFTGPRNFQPEMSSWENHSLWLAGSPTRRE